MLFATAMSNPHDQSPRGSTPVVLALSTVLGSLTLWLLVSFCFSLGYWTDVFAFFGIYFFGVLPALTLACALAARRKLRGALWIAPAFACGEWLMVLVRRGGDLSPWPGFLLLTAIAHAPAFGVALAITMRQGHRESRV